MAICALISGCSGAAGETLPQRRPLPAEPRPAPVMMFVGDSFTVGSGPVPTWRTYAAESARLLGWQPVIAGGGGSGFLNRGHVGRTFMESFEAELAWRPAPDLLVISGGHNDRRPSTLRVRRAAAALLWAARARWPHTRIVLIGPIWLEHAPARAYRVRDALEQVAARESVPFLDPLEQRWPARIVLPDGTHPTFAGHLRIARWLADALRGITRP
ncbi:MAG: SGNH/GDSL hydrolase family protein [Nonomuraea sp.]|nr:SGNH/GDSL hydrolase family protein [Nonomuraea sp.]